METSVKSGPRPCHDLGPNTTSGLIQEEMISNLVQFLREGPWKRIMGGILKTILEELDNCEFENLDAFFESSENIGTTTIQRFGGDTSQWTTFCATLANNIHELTHMHQLIHEWKVEFGKLSLQSDSDWSQRKLNAHAIYRHVYITVKSLMEKLDEPTLSLSTEASQ